MEPTQAKPGKKRLRRRWLIVTLVLVLVGAAWWNWPRGDARFVGKWKAHIDHHPESLDYVLELRRNGLAWIRSANGTTVVTLWSVGDESLVLGTSPNGLMGTLSAVVSQRLSSKSLRIRLGKGIDGWEIEAVDSNTVVLKGAVVEGSVRKTTLTRIPE